MDVTLAETDADIDRCFAVMAQLRPHLVREEFVAQVRRQQAGGYQLAFLCDGDDVTAVAGFRIGECLAWGRHLYVDDLVTHERKRSGGHGQALFDWLVRWARSNGCGELHLDSGVMRFDAHRFYLRNRMRIASHHFSMRLE